MCVCVYWVYSCVCRRMREFVRIVCVSEHERVCVGRAGLALRAPEHATYASGSTCVVAHGPQAPTSLPR